jgi:hypothetical protein
MALQEFWIASFGPFEYDDADTYPGGVDTFQSLYSPGGGIDVATGMVGTAPVGGSDIVRLDDITGITSLIDRLTSQVLTHSTLILSENATDQTLTGNLGNLELWAANYVGIRSAYQFPNTIGAVGEVLVVPALGTLLEWGTGGGFVLADVDRLTTQDASPSTMILSDDDIDQTLTHDLGNLISMVTGTAAGADHLFGKVGDAVYSRIYHANTGYFPFPVWGVLIGDPLGNINSLFGLADLSGSGSPETSFLTATSETTGDPDFLYCGASFAAMLGAKIWIGDYLNGLDNFGVTDTGQFWVGALGAGTH